MAQWLLLQGVTECKVRVNFHLKHTLVFGIKCAALCKRKVFLVDFSQSLKSTVLPSIAMLEHLCLTSRRCEKWEGNKTYEPAYTEKKTIWRKNHRFQFAEHLIADWTEGCGMVS